MWKLKTQPATPSGSQSSATDATQEQIHEFQEKAKREIAAALRQVPGPLATMQFGPPLLPERARGYNFALYSRFKDRAALDAYAISEAHMSVVNNVVKPYTEANETMAYDFEVPNDA
ncbi:hypothetical protein CTheo_744 [Ceratobasidium theobromae]|uniref:Stress-response A/B barrel domain-containing protein n=1 Tax=Ceratobasidium theobromae TaxID=1582974 RepID=A0A5N5QVW7_9AGAM|nr:hypothetical protein CTheo_744 [Ceratobasidium theobromae]